MKTLAELWKERCEQRAPEFKAEGMTTPIAEVDRNGGCFIRLSYELTAEQAAELGAWLVETFSNNKVFPHEAHITEHDIEAFKNRQGIAEIDEKWGTVIIR